MYSFSYKLTGCSFGQIWSFAKPEFRDSNMRLPNITTQEPCATYPHPRVAVAASCWGAWPRLLYVRPYSRRRCLGHRQAKLVRCGSWPPRPRVGSRRRRSAALVRMAAARRAPVHRWRQGRPNLGPGGLGWAQTSKAAFRHLRWLPVVVLGWDTSWGSYGLRPRAWRWWPPPPLGVVSRFRAGCGNLPISHLVLATSWGGMVAGESRALTSVMAGDGGVDASLPCWRHLLCRQHLLAHATPGETPDLGILDRIMATLFCVVIHLGASFLQQL
jgi:hypothetical protein